MKYFVIIFLFISCSKSNDSEISDIKNLDAQSCSGRKILYVDVNAPDVPQGTTKNGDLHPSYLRFNSLNDAYSAIDNKQNEECFNNYDEISIQIMPGIYSNDCSTSTAKSTKGHLTWRRHVLNQKISIEGNSPNPSQYPVLDYRNCSLLKTAIFVHATQKGYRENFHISRLKIQYAANGVSFNRKNQGGIGFKNVSVKNVLFEKIGSFCNDDRPADSDGTCKVAGYGYGAIVMQNVHDSQIIDNSFINIGNFYDESKFDGDMNQIHAIYSNGGGNGNLIEGNYMRNVSGEPIKFDNSSINTVRNNKIYNSGRAAAVSEYNAKLSAECPSIKNRIEDNVIHGTYNCTRRNLPRDKWPYGKKPIYDYRIHALPVAFYRKGWGGPAYLTSQIDYFNFYKSLKEDPNNTIYNNCQFFPQGERNYWYKIINNHLSAGCASVD